MRYSNLQKSMISYIYIIFIMWSILYVLPAHAINTISAYVKSEKNATYFIINFDQKPQQIKKFTLSKPERIVLDITDLNWNSNRSISSKGIIKKIRFGKGKKVGRIVLDLQQKIMQSSYTLKPTSQKNKQYTLKLKLTYQQKQSFETRRKKLPSKPKPDKAKQTAPNKYFAQHVLKNIQRRNPNEIIITVDAGHGGPDPGAISVSGYKEKDIVLAFAKEFANAINRQKNMRAILTRDKDFIIPLAARPLIAKHYQSDLFISIHADALKEDKNFSGSTIYTLSDTASDAIAAKLAESENRSDIVAGINFDNQLPEITDILIDFMRRETDIASYEFAQNLVQKLKNSTKLVSKPHRKAGFKVLKSPNIPSVLIELGYLTSITDERRLTNPQKRRKMIKGMIDAIKIWHYQRRLSGH